MTLENEAEAQQERETGNLAEEYVPEQELNYADEKLDNAKEAIGESKPEEAIKNLETMIKKNLGLKLTWAEFFSDMINDPKQIVFKIFQTDKEGLKQKSKKELQGIIEVGENDVKYLTDQAGKVNEAIVKYNVAIQDAESSLAVYSSKSNELKKRFAVINDKLSSGKLKNEEAQKYTKERDAIQKQIYEIDQKGNVANTVEKQCQKSGNVANAMYGMLWNLINDMGDLIGEARTEYISQGGSSLDEVLEPIAGNILKMSEKLRKINEEKKQGSNNNPDGNNEIGGNNYASLRKVMAKSRIKNSSNGEGSQTYAPKIEAKVQTWQKEYQERKNKPSGKA